MKYPYTVTTGGLASTIRQLRSSFPAQVTAETLKKWSIAPNNETYILNVLRFLGVIDEDCKKDKEIAKVFVEHDDDAFARKFEAIVQETYTDLFEHFGEETWELDKARLISYFRSTDETSATVGKRQAGTFQLLAAIAGHGDVPAALDAKPASPAKPRAKSKPKSRRTKKTEQPAPPAMERFATGLALRVEINLPVTDDQEVYDKIFRSIRENLLNE